MPWFPRALASALLLTVAGVVPNAAHAAPTSYGHPTSVVQRRAATAAGSHAPTPAHHAPPGTRPTRRPTPTTPARHLTPNQRSAATLAPHAAAAEGAQDSATASVPADFNGDGKSDLVWVNYTTGELKVAYMDGAIKLGEDALGQVPQNWWLAAVASFDGDGQPDLYFRNYATGENQVWLMNGITQVTTVTLPSMDPSWVLSGAADFDGDGQTDLVWRSYQADQHGNAPTQLWLMNGASIASTVDVMDVGTHWLLEAAADVNGDGQTDLVFDDPLDDQDLALVMNGTSVQSHTSGLPVDVDTNWRITGSPYVGPDGQAGVVKRNYLTGRNMVTVYDFNQPDPSQPKLDTTRSFELPAQPDTNWQLVDPMGVSPQSLLSAQEVQYLEAEATTLSMGGGGYNSWDGDASRLHTKSGQWVLPGPSYAYPSRAASSPMYRYRKQQLEHMVHGMRIRLDAQILPPLGSGYKMFDAQTGHTALYAATGEKLYVESNDAWN